MSQAEYPQKATGYDPMLNGRESYMAVRAVEAFGYEVFLTPTSNRRGAAEKTPVENLLLSAGAMFCI